MRTVLLVLSMAAAGCSRTEPTSKRDPATTTKPTQDPAAARKLIDSGAIVLDVRTADEFAAEHLPNATNIPVDKVAEQLAQVDKLAGGDKSKPIVVYCAAGARSAKAKQTLESAGYTRVVNGGGLDDLR
ncbi:MAG: rhodanese-like domain-containing protein [Deltaproteobacteria bacterium]|nr:rhodanese-like domain-containing protein [Deltaproteobacteria bacterium]